MEKQKLVYEEKALIALQKATQDKTEANSKAATLQVNQFSSLTELNYSQQKCNIQHILICENEDAM